MKLRDIILGISIMILTIFVVVYGISLFYPSPQYEDYCLPVKTQEIIDNEARCIEIGGQWTSYGSDKMGDIRGYCDRDYSCRKDYESARELRSKIIFFIALPLGILLLVLGGLFFGLEAVGAGLMGGGVGTILYGAGGYWRYSDDLLRFILSLLGLAAVIYLSYWFNNRGKRKKLLFWRK